MFWTADQVAVFIGFVVSFPMALDACPDGKIILNVTSLEECNNKCIRYRKTFNEMTFTCAQASISPIMNETDIYTCTLIIESDWKMWIKNTEVHYDGWKPYTSERYTGGFILDNGDFFGGTEKMVALTGSCSQCSMRFRMWDYQGHYGWMEYSEFILRSRMHLTGDVTGNVGDGMSLNKGRFFSTEDDDNDQLAGYNFAQHLGPWWHHYSLYGTYLMNSQANGIVWAAWKWGDIKQNLQRAEVHVKCKGQ